MSDKTIKDRETITRLIRQIVKLEGSEVSSEDESWLLRFLRQQLNDVIAKTTIDEPAQFVSTQFQLAGMRYALDTTAGLSVPEMMARIRLHVESPALGDREARELEALLDRMMATPLDEIPEPDSQTAQVVATAIGLHAAKLRKMQEPCDQAAPAETPPPAKTVIELTLAEIRSGLDRVKWDEGLIRQLPEDHEGANSWLINYRTAQGLVKKGRPLYSLTTGVEETRQDTDRPCTCGPNDGCAWCQYVPSNYWAQPFKADSKLGEVDVEPISFEHGQFHVKTCIGGEDIEVSVEAASTQQGQERVRAHIASLPGRRPKQQAPATIMELIEHHIALRVEEDIDQYARESASDAMHTARRVFPKDSPEAMLLLKTHTEKAEELASQVAADMRLYHLIALRKRYANALIDLCMRPAPVSRNEVLSDRVAPDRLVSPYGQDTAA